MTIAATRAQHLGEMVAPQLSREDVELTSRGATLRGWLYRPAGPIAATVSAPRPAIVMAHGFSAVREMFLAEYAEAFAAAGFVTLVYDHFGFGASDGEPRQWPAPSWQQEGYRDAVAWLRSQVGVDRDRVGIWGSSYSGGHVITLAAQDVGVRCAVAQVAAIGSSKPSDATVEILRSALKAGRHDEKVPVTSPTADGVGLLFHDDAHAWFARVSAARAPTWRNEVCIGALAEPFRPIDALPHAKIPLRMIIAPKDALVPPMAAIPVAKAAPLVDLVEVGGDHFNAYEAGFAESSSLAIDWFTRHLNA